MKKFLLADDHVVVRSGIKALLGPIFAETEIHEAINGETVMQQLKENEYDLVILDIQMPKTDSLALMEYIHKNYPLTKVLVFSMSSENIYAKRFISAGAMGFVSKEAPMDEIVSAINLILNNKKYISGSLADKLAGDSLSGKPINPFNALSPKEFEIATLLLAGKTVSEIAHALNIHTSTVGTHKTRLFDKIGVKNILQLKELAVINNL